VSLSEFDDQFRDGFQRHQAGIDREIVAKLVGGQMQDFAIYVLQSKLLRDNLSNSRAARAHLPRK
jgi:hypothetical protein